MTACQLLCINVSLVHVSVALYLNLRILTSIDQYGLLSRTSSFTGHLTAPGNRSINPVLDSQLFLHLNFLFHPILPLVASLLPSRVSSWLMSSLGPELCQGAWYCSWPNQEDIRGPRWSLGTEHGSWKHDRKVSELPALVPTVLRLFSSPRL